MGWGKKMWNFLRNDDVFTKTDKSRAAQAADGVAVIIQSGR
jgi:hypothetical protein